MFSIRDWRQFCRYRLFGLPWSVVDTTREYCLQSGDPYCPVDASREFHRIGPRTGHHEMIEAYRRYARQQACQPATFVATLPSGRVFDHRGYVVSGDGVLLHDVSRHYGAGNPHDHRLMRQLLWGGISRKLPGRATVLTSAGTDIYYHWLLDLLPRIGILQRAGFELASFDWFIVPGNRIRKGDEILERLGIPRKKLVPVSRSRRIQADELVVPSYASEAMRPSREVVAYLRDGVEPALRIQDAPPPSCERLYVRRSGRRKLVNQDAVEAVLQEYGFQTISCETLSIAEQIRAFSRARVVVGVHGAGLANAVFCRPGCAMVELTVPACSYFCFWDLAAAAGLNLYSVFGRGGYDPAAPPAPRADVTIDPLALAGCLRQVMADTAR